MESLEIARLLREAFPHEVLDIREHRGQVAVLLRHERGRIKDWHYDGVAANPTPAANMQTYLDAGPQDYKVTVLGVMLQLGW